MIYFVRSGFHGMERSGITGQNGVGVPIASISPSLKKEKSTPDHTNQNPSEWKQKDYSLYPNQKSIVYSCIQHPAKSTWVPGQRKPEASYIILWKDCNPRDSQRMGEYDKIQGSLPIVEESQVVLLRLDLNNVCEYTKNPYDRNPGGHWGRSICGSPNHNHKSSNSFSMSSREWTMFSFPLMKMQPWMSCFVSSFPNRMTGKGMSR